jgi:hypothetical protein
VRTADIMPEVADIADKEKRIVTTIMKERYGRKIPLQIIHCGSRHPSDRGPTLLRPLL